MAALTAAQQRKPRHWGPAVQQNWRVANADTIYVGSFCGVPGTNALTSRRGYLTTYRDQVNMMWAGLCAGTGTAGDLSTSDSIVGNTSATPVAEASTYVNPFVLDQYTVTGVSAQTDVLRIAVYASNDNDLTTTASYPAAIGRVVYWWSSTTADVLFYGVLASIVI